MDCEVHCGNTKSSPDKFNSSQPNANSFSQCFFESAATHGYEVFALSLSQKLPLRSESFGAAETNRILL